MTAEGSMKPNCHTSQCLKLRRAEARRVEHSGVVLDLSCSLKSPNSFHSSEFLETNYTISMAFHGFTLPNFRLHCLTLPIRSIQPCDVAAINNQLRSLLTCAPVQQQQQLWLEGLHRERGLALSSRDHRATNSLQKFMQICRIQKNGKKSGFDPTHSQHSVEPSKAAAQGRGKNQPLLKCWLTRICIF